MVAHAVFLPDHHRPIRAERFEGRLTLGEVGNIRIDMESWNTPLELTGTSPRDGLSFVVPLQERSSYLSGGLEITADRIDIFGPECEVDAVTTQFSTLVSCSLSIGDLDERVYSPMAMLVAEKATGHSVVRSTGPTIGGLRRWWLELLGLCGRSYMPGNAKQRLFDETLSVIARALSTGEEKPVARPRRRCWLARRARDYMLERQSNPPTIAEICAFLGTSERALHYAFNETYGVAPKHFLNARRLFAVHQELKSATPEDRISDIATSLGFWDLGYFAKNYQAMFGELPSATLGRDHD